jgi:hypothetical protein
MKSALQWLGRAMGDGENPSSSRLVAVPALLAIYLVPLAVWTVLSLRTHAMLDVPTSVLGLIGSVSGPLLAFLHWNKRVEEGTKP